MSYSELFFVSTNFLLHSRHFPHWIHLPYSPNQSNYLSINLSGICNRFYSLNNCKSGQPKTKQNFLYNFLYKNICGNHGRDSDFWYEQSWPNYAGVKSQICATELLTFFKSVWSQIILECDISSASLCTDWLLKISCCASLLPFMLPRARTWSSLVASIVKNNDTWMAASHFTNVDRVKYITVWHQVLTAFLKCPSLFGNKDVRRLFFLVW